MKYSSRFGYGHIYDPRAKIKKELKKVIKAKSGLNPQCEYPRVSFIFHMAIPKSTPKRLLPLYQTGLVKHLKKPDTDNFIKIYLDCLDGICFVGDQRVSLGPSIKL